MAPSCTAVGPIFHPRTLTGCLYSRCCEQTPTHCCPIWNRIGSWRDNRLQLLAGCASIVYDCLTPQQKLFNCLYHRVMFFAFQLSSLNTKIARQVVILLFLLTHMHSPLLITVSIIFRSGLQLLFSNLLWLLSSYACPQRHHWC
jgi:hypothetical protein